MRLVQTKVKDCTATHALADITETGDDSDLAGKHDIGGTLDTVDEGLAAAVLKHHREHNADARVVSSRRRTHVVVELGLGDRVVDVDGGDLELAVTEQLVEVVDTGGGLLGDTLDVCKG
jgi:hypothetical protein